MTELPDTLTQVIDRLNSQGYTEDLNRAENNALWLDPDAYHADGVYRFEGATNPDDDRVAVASYSICPLVGSLPAQRHSGQWIWSVS